MISEITHQGASWALVLLSAALVLRWIGQEVMLVRRTAQSGRLIFPAQDPSWAPAFYCIFLVLSLVNLATHTA